MPLHKHPAVMEADVICLNWVNRGLLSLKEAERITALGKPVVWTMHDMWNMTGICHHAALCDRFSDECGCCPLLGHNGDENDLSRRVQLKKRASLRHRPRAERRPYICGRQQLAGGTLPTFHAAS